MRRLLKKFLFLLIPVYIFSSCEKTDDFSKLKLDYVYKGSFSLPIGDTSLTLARNGYQLPINWQNLPDSLLQRIDSFPIRSDVSFSFINPVSRLDYIKRLIFRLDALNEFPAEIHLKFMFLAADNSILDSLSENFVVPPAELRNDSTVVKKGQTLKDIEVMSDHYLKWLTVNNVVVTAYVINNPNAIKYYRYFPNYELELHMGFRVDFDFNIQRSL